MRPLAATYATLVAVALVTRARFAAALVLVLGLVALATWFQMRAAERSVTIGRSYEDRAFIGDVVEVSVRVANASRWPQASIHIRDATPTHLVAVSGAAPNAVVSVSGRGESAFTYEVVARRRGYHRLGPASMTASDVLRLESRAVPPPPDDRLIVYPEILAIEALGLPARGPVAELAAPGALLEDAARFSNLRPYVFGEDARKIHWPATARTGSVMARQPETAQSRDTIVCLDLGRSAYRSGWQSNVELAVTAAASVAHHVVVRDELSVGLYCHGVDPSRRGPMAGIPAGAGVSHLMVILESLARIGSVAEGEFATVLESAFHHAPFGSTIVTITGRADDDLIDVLHRARRRGHEAAIIVVGDRSARRERVSGVPVFPVPDRAAVGALA